MNGYVQRRTWLTSNWKLCSQSSDVRSLLGRSLARAKSTYYTEALADAARAAGT